MLLKETREYLSNHETYNRDFQEGRKGFLLLAVLVVLSFFY